MNLQVGLKFKVYYNKGNIYNIKCCEVRGIIDNSQVVLLCEKEKTSMSKGMVFYKMISVNEFEYFEKHKIFIEL